MKFLELRPTNENIQKTWKEDKLQRRNYALRFITLLNSIEDICAIALDGRWGSGKTFFVKQVKMLLDAFNGSEEFLNIEESAQIKAEIEKTGGIQVQKQLSFYYDAWINDNDEDPIVSLLYSILQDVEHCIFEASLRKNYLVKLANLTVDIADFFLPGAQEGWRKFKEAWNNSKDVLQRAEAPELKELFAPLRAKGELHDEVQKLFNALLGEQYKRLVIFVDELDRCKPSYAIKLLERIKHYLSDDRVTFVFSVNIEELQHMVKCCYGPECSASRYLDRFFDLRASLPELDVDSFFRANRMFDGHYEMICTVIIKTYQLQLREILKFSRLMKIMTRRITQALFRMEYESTLHFCVRFILPVMIGLKLTDQTQYRAFVEGENSSPLLALLENERAKKDIHDWLVGVKESSSNSENDEDSNFLKEQFEKIYYFLFTLNLDFFYHDRVVVCKLMFDDFVRNFLSQTITLLSDFADFK